MTEVFLALGSNLGDKKRNCLKAINGLRKKNVGPLLALSSPYLTSPYGFEDQPWFINCVCKFKTHLGPRGLLGVCQSVERELGRVREVRWGPRIIDIDILLYGDVIVDEDDLKIPHPELDKRLFFLVPMLEIDGSVVDPATGRDIRYLVEHGRFEGQKVVKVSW